MKNEKALRFIQLIRVAPAYWSSAKKDLFAILRQLGIPTWFVRSLLQNTDGMMQLQQFFDSKMTTEIIIC